MRFAHLSDSHLGYRQFGLLERENDFYEVFAKNIDEIIDKDVDFVIHSGDLFDNNRPSTEALLAFQKALLRLNEEKIPIYAIAGNHDSILRKGALPPQVLFKDIGLKIISPDHPFYTEGAVLICGVPYAASSQSLALKEMYKQLSKLADKSLKSILVSHQGIDKWMHEDAHEIELNELPKNFDYYAMGHIHNYIEEDYGKGKLVYPGSMEIWRTSESNQNYRDFGKGFVVVDLSHERPEVERVKIDLPRKFYKEVIEYKDLNEKLYVIKERIESLENKPMIDLTVMGGNFDSADVYDTIRKSIGNYVLNLRPSFKPDDVLEFEEVIDKNKILDPRTILSQKVDEKYGEKRSKLSVDLLDNLSLGKVEEAKFISDRFYSENYYNASDLNDNSNSEIEEPDNDSSNSLDDYLNENLDAKSDNISDNKSDAKSDVKSEGKLEGNSGDKSDSDNNSQSINPSSNNSKDKKTNSRELSFDNF